MSRLSSFKKILVFITALSVVSGCLAGCSDSSTLSSEEPERIHVEEETEVPTEKTTAPSEPKVRKEYDKLFSDRDKSQSWDGDIAASIELSGETASVSGSGAECDGSTVIITAEGTYLLKGSLSGQVRVNAPGAKIQLILDNAEITNDTGAAIYGENSDKIFVTTSMDSVNKLSNGDLSSQAEQEPCVFSKDSLTFNGLGSLEVSSSSCDGIHSKDDVVVTGGKLSITAKGDGLKGKDYVGICGNAEITVSSEEDGIKSTNSAEPAMGFIYIEDGKLSITAGNDGIQAETDLVTVGGEFEITSGGGADNSTKVHTDDFGGFGRDKFNGQDVPEDFDFSDFSKRPGGMTPPDGFDPENMTPPNGFDPGSMTPPDGFDPGNMAPPDGITGATPDATDNNKNNSSSAETDSSDSGKGLKSGSSLDISGGTFVIDSADDTLHSNSDVLISGGQLTLTAGDDGIHGDSSVRISGGQVNITRSYEGIEAAVIDISGGSVELTSSDDGLNASDGSAQNGFGVYSKEVQLNISGGAVYVNAEGDGLDSNGDLTISGGTVLVDGPTIGANGALDGNGEIVITGGLVIAAGASDMAEYPGESSTQYSVSAGLEQSQQGGTLVTLLDDKGNEIISYAPSKKFSHIVISSPDIKQGQTYKLSLGGSSSSAEVHGLYQPGGYSNDGDPAGEFTADKVTSFIGKQSTMGGGMGGHGGFNKGDFQPTTDENGQPVMPEGGKGGRFHGGRGEKTSGGNS